MIKNFKYMLFIDIFCYISYIFLYIFVICLIYIFLFLFHCSINLFTIILIDVYLIRQKRQRTHVHAAGEQRLGLHYCPRNFIGHVDLQQIPDLPGHAIGTFAEPGIRQTGIRNGMLLRPSAARISKEERFAFKT